MRMLTPIDAPVVVIEDARPDAASTDFVDTFTRANSANIGNGWIEKNPAAFSITDGEVTRVATSPESYRDNLVYRPEDVLDVEISVNVRFTQTPPRFPQIFVRGRALTTVNSYDGYLLYVDGGAATNQVVLGRQLGMPFVVTLSSFTLTEPLNTTARYRMVLSAQGTMPVMLSARIERLNPVTIIGSTTFSDGAAERITTAGRVGFAGDEVAAYIYDDFRRVNL